MTAAPIDVWKIIFPIFFPALPATKPRGAIVEGWGRPIWDSLSGDQIFPGCRNVWPGIVGRKGAGGVGRFSGDWQWLVSAARDCLLSILVL